MEMNKMSTEERVKSLLADLGKATLRGIRKCPKCGTYNGSRGVCCKNKNCDAVFKEPGEKRKLFTEACKLITGSSAQVFSVKVRDRGPEQRGFVQLPVINLDTSSDSTAATPSSSALCFVDNCEKSFNNTVLQCHEKSTAKASRSSCQHVQAALRCYAEAQPLTLRHSVLSSLHVNDEIKQDIWMLATETSGPLVQRVSKNIMSVKCKASPKHPLGYLHFSFFTTKLKDKVEHKFACNCSSFKGTNKACENKIDESAKRCVHFYACICAFASDPKLSEEFQYYLNLDQPDLTIEEALDFELIATEADKFVQMDLDSFTDDTHLLIFRDDTLKAESLQSDRLDIDINSINLDPSILASNIDNVKDHDYNLLSDSNVVSEICNLELIDQNAVFDGNTIKIIQDPSMIDTNMEFDVSHHFLLTEQQLKQPNGATIKILDHNLLLDTSNIKLLESNVIPVNNEISCLSKVPVKKKRIQPAKRKKVEENKNLSSIITVSSIEPKKARTQKSQTSKKYPNIGENIDEATTNLSFIRWLSSITERINQTMHFQFDGKPEPLVFHVPQTFFECLRERISCGGKKKRLPNSTTAFVRRDSIPLGTFIRYTWHITNILHVKRIFETPLISLEITRSFVQNSDGTYQIYKSEEAECDRLKKNCNNPVIKPLEFKTFLKVGNTSPNQVQPTPFLIEWIPDILPISKIGELRIKFEFGHIKSEFSPKMKKVALPKNY